MKDIDPQLLKSLLPSQRLALQAEDYPLLLLLQQHPQYSALKVLRLLYWWHQTCERGESLVQFLTRHRHLSMEHLSRFRQWLQWQRNARQMEQHLAESIGDRLHQLQVPINYNPPLAPADPVAEPTEVCSTTPTVATNTQPTVAVPAPVSGAFTNHNTNPERPTLRRLSTATETVTNHKPPSKRQSVPTIVAPTEDIRAEILEEGPTITIGSQVGPCVIQSEVGRGAFGKVFRAWHQSLRMPVALKVWQAKETEESQLARKQFTAEARLLSQITHPNIIRLWDFCDTSSPPYLVMEWVDGTSMSQYLRQHHRLPWRVAGSLAWQMTLALRALDQRGIIHRDVKPSNILLSKMGQIKLTDFGLAALRDDPNAPEITPVPLPDDCIVGTVEFMAPEQALGGAPDRRSDIYSLGITLYLLVVGQVPFRADTARKVMHMHAFATPLKPHVVVPGLPTEVGDFILRMIAKRPHDRFQNYDEVLDALTRLGQMLHTPPNAATTS